MNLVNFRNFLKLSSCVYPEPSDAMGDGMLHPPPPPKKHPVVHCLSELRNLVFGLLLDFYLLSSLEHAVVVGSASLQVEIVTEQTVIIILKAIKSEPWIRNQDIK